MALGSLGTLEQQSLKKLRVSMGMSELLKGHFLLGLIIVGWAMFLLKRKWAARDKHRVSQGMGFNVIKDSLIKGAKMKGMCEIFEHSRLQKVMLEGAFELPNGDEFGPDALGVHFTNLSLQVKVNVSLRVCQSWAKVEKRASL